MIKAIIFDMDGTLIDSMQQWYKLCEIYVRKNGKSNYLEARNLLKEYSIKEGVEILKRKFDFNTSLETIEKELKDLMYELYIKEARLKKGVINFLEENKENNIKMFLATATDRSLTLKVIKYFNIEKYFYGIITVNEIKKRKTEPDIYNYCLEKMKVKKEECLVFEDALYAIKTLYKNGFQTIGVKDLSEEDKEKEIKELVKYYISDFDNIKL